MPRRIRVLLIAESANPEWVSVPLEGWSHSQAISRLCDAHVVTQQRNREAFLRAGLEEGKQFTALDSEAVAGPIWKAAGLLRRLGFGWTVETAADALPYYYFEHLLWQRFGPGIRSGAFDVVHRITPLSPTHPSIIAGRCRAVGVPFVMGPLNGGLPWPRGFGSVQRKEGEWLSYVRDAYKLLPGFRAGRRDAAAIVVGSGNALAQVPARFRDKCVYVPENGIDTSRFNDPRDDPPGLPVRAAFVGRLVPYKGADMLIEAAADLARRGRMRVDIYGDGPQRSDLERLLDRLGVRGPIALHGNVPHTSLQARLREADIFAFPSIREFGGAVVLEAMSLGVVPVVVRYGGPGELPTPATGYLVEIGSRDEVVERFRAHFEQIVAAPEGLREKSLRARERVRRSFTWDAKARQIHEVYEWVLGQGPKPENPIPLAD